MVMTYRSGYGEDGSDQMLTIVAAGLLSFALLPESTPWRPIGLWFIAAQSVLSYTAAGISKLAAPLWRNGRASLMIFRTETYSNPTVAHMLERSRAAQIALAWTTILFECLFPLALFAPMPVAVTLLALGFVFHLANAFVMGLNVFFWAFVATYPAVLLLRLAIIGM
jgi:hypothetical protein